jgi:hypothetical protein
VPWVRTMAAELSCKPLNSSPGGGAVTLVLEAKVPGLREHLLRTSVKREDLMAERTRGLNRLHGLLRVLVPGGVALYTKSSE